MNKKHAWFDNVWCFTIRDKQGNVVWQDKGRNALVDEGEEWVLRAAFRKDHTTDRLYIRLANQVITESTTLSDITTEPSGNGYAAVEITRDTTGFPTIDTDSGDKRLTSKLVTFTASGGSIGPISVAYLATTADNTGKLICFKSFPIIQTILETQTGDAFFRLKLS